MRFPCLVTRSSDHSGGCVAVYFLFFFHSPEVCVCREHVQIDQCILVLMSLSCCPSHCSFGCIEE